MGNVDLIYKNNCKYILQNGTWHEEKDLYWRDGAPVRVLSGFGIVNRYDVGKEFPILTLRRTKYDLAIKEMLWIWQKKSTNISELGCHIWDSAADETGDIGKAYGYQLSRKDKYSEGYFDQVDRLLYDLKNNPYSRRMIANMYVFSDLYASNIYPCAYSITLGVVGNKLNMILNQRSQEMLISNSWNVTQYAALLCMFAYSNGYEPGELIHCITTAIIYDRHIDIIKNLLKLEPYDSPNVTINKKQDYYDYTVEDFVVNNYHYYPSSMKIEIPKSSEICLNEEKYN